MAKNINWTSKDLKDKKLIEVNGSYVKAESQLSKKVEKIILPPDYMSFNNIHTVFLDGSSERLLKPNAKIKNATKSINQNGVKFDSKLEKYMYELLQGEGIDFEFQKVYILQEKFKFGTEAIIAIKKIVDFYLPLQNMIIDTKGYSNDVSPMKHKMLKRHLQDCFETGNNISLTRIEMPRNKKECDLLLNRILYDK